MVIVGVHPWQFSPSVSFFLLKCKWGQTGQTRPNGENSANKDKCYRGPNGAKRVQTGPTGAKRGQTRSNRAKQGPSGPNGTKHYQMGPNMGNPGQMVSNLAKWDDQMAITGPCWLRSALVWFRFVLFGPSLPSLTLVCPV